MIIFFAHNTLKKKMIINQQGSWTPHWLTEYHQLSLFSTQLSLHHFAGHKNEMSDSLYHWNIRNTDNDVCWKHIENVALPFPATLYTFEYIKLWQLLRTQSNYVTCERTWYIVAQYTYVLWQIQFVEKHNFELGSLFLLHPSNGLRTCVFATIQIPYNITIIVKVYEVFEYSIILYFIKNSKF